MNKVKNINLLCAQLVLTLQSFHILQSVIHSRCGIFSSDFGCDFEWKREASAECCEVESSDCEWTVLCCVECIELCHAAFSSANWAMRGSMRHYLVPIVKMENISAQPNRKQFASRNSVRRTRKSARPSSRNKLKNMRWMTFDDGKDQSRNIFNEIFSLSFFESNQNCPQLSPTLLRMPQKHSQSHNVFVINFSSWKTKWFHFIFR